MFMHYESTFPFAISPNFNVVNMSPGCRSTPPLHSRPVSRNLTDPLDSSPLSNSYSCFDYLSLTPHSPLETWDSISTSSSSFSSSPECTQSQSPVVLVSVMFALIEDLGAISHDLSEIQADLKALHLPKPLLDIPATPRFIYTPPTPVLDSETVELEDWEIQQKLSDMVLEVELMYLDVVEMAEEGLFPDDAPRFAEPSQDDFAESWGDQPLEPEDVMRLLEQLAIPQMLEDEEGEYEECSSSTLRLSSSSEIARHDEDLFDEEPTPIQASHFWSARFDSFESIDSTPTQSESEGGADLSSTHSTPSKTYNNDVHQRLSIVDESFLESFPLAISPLSRFIHLHSAERSRCRRPARRIQPSPTISFTPAPIPQTLIARDTSVSFRNSLFSEPAPLLPFSVRLPPASPSARDSTSRHSFWDKLKGIKRQKYSLVDPPSHLRGSLDLSPLKKFFGSSDRRPASSPVRFIYDSTSVKGAGCLPLDISR